MNAGFEFHLFATRPEFVQEAVSAGVSSIIVDWENVGKSVRQADADTQINYDTLEDLERVRACTSAGVICRINGIGETTFREVEQAISAGVDEIFLPMVRTCQEVVEVLDQVQTRCGVGILVETAAALEIACDLACLPLSRVYVGLNDLAIDRGATSIFSALADGTVEDVRQHFPHIPFGFAGLTLPDRGSPLPCRLLIGEMARLKCNFSFLRRSFLRDVRDQNLASAVSRIQEAFQTALRRSHSEIDRDRQELVQCINELASGGEGKISRWML